MDQASRWQALSIGDATPTYEYEVTAEAIAHFCRSARYENLVYTNQPAARERGLPGIVAPPAMALVYAPVRVGQLLPHGGFPGHPTGEPEWPAPEVRIEVEFQGSLVEPGDVISSVTSVRDKGERDGGRYLSLEVIARNQRSELVARIGCTYRWPLTPT